MSIPKQIVLQAAIIATGMLVSAGVVTAKHGSGYGYGCCGPKFGR